MISMHAPSVFHPVATSAGVLPSSEMKRTERSYELKFRVPQRAIDPILDCARSLLPPDPNADPAKGDGYSIHTLYFDTKDLSVYRRSGSYKNAKYRIRRYGMEEVAYLERKSKPQGRVCKHRVRMPIEELGYLEEVAPPEGWAGAWFHHRLQALRLTPICQLSYQRVARVGILEDQPIRFTMDRRICGEIVPRIAPPRSSETARLILPIEESIAEIKFTESLPVAFDRLLGDLNVTSSAISKYRIGIRELHLAPEILS